MGAENRGSSGGSTVMIVIAILAGLLLVGCCGGVVVIGSVFMVGKEADDDSLKTFKAVKSQEQIQRELDQANEEAKKEQP
jgi:hypothetical protein